MYRSRCRCSWLERWRGIRRSAPVEPERCTRSSPRWARAPRGSLARGAESQAGDRVTLPDVVPCTPPRWARMWSTSATSLPHLVVPLPESERIQRVLSQSKSVPPELERGAITLLVGPRQIQGLHQGISVLGGLAEEGASHEQLNSA